MVFYKDRNDIGKLIGFREFIRKNWEYMGEGEF
jgi:hypothetical protein